MMAKRITESDVMIIVTQYFAQENKKYGFEPVRYIADNRNGAVLAIASNIHDLKKEVPFINLTLKSE